MLPSLHPVKECCVVCQKNNSFTLSKVVFCVEKTISLPAVMCKVILTDHVYLNACVQSALAVSAPTVDA